MGNETQEEICSWCGKTCKEQDMIKGGDDFHYCSKACIKKEIEHEYPVKIIKIEFTENK